MEPSISVVVADDHPLVRAAVSELLDAAEGLSVVGQATDGRAALDLVEKLRPDVVLMDVTMPAMSGIEATRVLNKHTPVFRCSCSARTSGAASSRPCGLQARPAFWPQAAAEPT